MKIRTLAIATILLATTAVNAQNFELAYNSDTGALDLTKTAAATANATTVEIVSAGGQLRGEKNAAIFAGLFDVYTANKAFKLDPGGFGDIAGFAFLDAGITDASTVDLSIDGSLVGGGPLGDVAITGIGGGGGPVDPPVTSDTNFIYNPATGNLDFSAGGKTVTTLEVVSAGGLFVGDKDPAIFAGLFDVYSAGKAFKLDPGGFGDIAGFATIGTGLTAAAVAADFSIDGSIAGGGPLGSVGVVAVPEPASFTLIGMGVLALGLVRRRRS